MHLGKARPEGRLHPGAQPAQPRREGGRAVRAAQLEKRLPFRRGQPAAAGEERLPLPLLHPGRHPLALDARGERFIARPALGPRDGIVDPRRRALEDHATNAAGAEHGRRERDPPAHRVADPGAGGRTGPVQHALEIVEHALERDPPRTCRVVTGAMPRQIHGQDPPSREPRERGFTPGTRRPTEPVEEQQRRPLACGRAPVRVAHGDRELQPVRGADPQGPGAPTEPPRPRWSPKGSG